MDQATDSITWKNYLDAGNRAFELGRYDDAEKLYQKSLIEARREFAEGTLHSDNEVTVNLTLPDPDGETALLLSIINMHFDFASYLISAGADVNHTPSLFDFSDLQVPSQTKRERTRGRRQGEQTRRAG